MAKFSARSQSKLNTCDERLQRVFNAVIKEYDCTILEGHRGEERQNQLFDMGQSKLRYPQGKHNSIPSKAVDVAPYPIDWNDRERFVLFAGYVLGIATQMGVKLRWGGDWSQSWNSKNTAFFDAPHFEIVEQA